MLVITRNQSDVYGRNLVEIDPTSLPQLSKQLRDLNHSQKHEKHDIQNFKKNMFLDFWIKFEDSRHTQVAIYRVFDEESESEVKKCLTLELGGKT